jgi:cytochrome P450
MAVSVNINDQSYKEFKEIIESLVSAKVTPLGPGIYKEFIENHPNINLVMSLFHGPTISGASSLTGALEFITLDLYRENQLSNLLNDRSLIPAAVNESLRFHASTGRFSRTVIKDVTLHGVDLKSGNRVALCLESANRDPDKFVEPDKFNLNRDTTGQLAFGHGLHACIALAITKAVMTRYLELLLDTVGQYRVTTPTSDLTYIMTASGNDDMINNLYIEKE